ncbi:transporter family protein [Ohtaekwangia koreensis]|uniref:MetA-pathway of phenol degradation n=1 Tax=Ohtaekwangia koreensis TaxID=688867 RepID=A0A1T5LM88_9BACT|nr:hypothetical protein [Ohtaekwangia koreensis]SKC77107.1 hypothetical protein SAMN05660236_3513 [Ohtaekwangia koreensis]
MNVKFYSIYILLFAVLLANTNSFAQGCVAVRNMSSCSLSFDSTVNKSWQLSMNYRYFKSFRHFRGKEEEKNRVDNGTEVINNDNSLLLGVSYTLNRRWSFSATIPLIFIDRSSLYEHKGNTSGERYHTSSKGLGDIRVMGYLSALPHARKTHLLVGLGVKLPTGNYNYKDDFHKADGIQHLPVDQSIQLGDGGTGIITEFDFSQQLGIKWHGYATGIYLFNPRNTNGTLRSQTLTNNIPLSNEMSVVDQFLFRVGARYSIKKIQLSLGGRYEGIPYKDVFGDSDGFRRPGYIISVEPAIAFTTGQHSFGANLPIALERNRTQSVIDKERTKITGTYQHGDAAFADWLISISYAYRLSK